MANQNGGDEKAVEEIVYKLKSQGLFDQLRKECLNDVDTKPAYQNLRQRVEGYVSRFLSQQTWSPNLNKNQLRDSLRRQINQSGMLSSGVERIIEQVVNPKIFTIIKPKIDEIVCRHLGVDPDERQSQLEARKQRQHQFQQQQMQQQQQQPQLPKEPVPLMSLGTSPGQSPGYDGLSVPGNNPYAAYSPSANWHRPFGTMLNPLLNSNYQVNPQYNQSFGSYGMTSPLYPYTQQGWGIHAFPGMVPPLFTQPPPPIPPTSVSEAPALPQAPPFTEPPPPLPTEPYSGGEEPEVAPAPPPEPEPPATGLTPPGISPVTLPPSTPVITPTPSVTPTIPPSTPPTPATPQADSPSVSEKSTDITKQTDTTKSNEKMSRPESKPKTETKQADGTYNILKDIPLPIPLPGGSETSFKPETKKKANSSTSKTREKTADKAKENNKDGNEPDNTAEHKLKDFDSGGNHGNKATDSEVKSQDEKAATGEEPVITELTAVSLEPTKQYTFSWSAGALAGSHKDDEEMSNLSISSVHTSDLSSFEDDVGSASEAEESTANEDAAVEKCEDTTGEIADASGSQSESVDLASPGKLPSPIPVKPPSPAEVEVEEATSADVEVETVVVSEPIPESEAVMENTIQPVSAPAQVSPPKPKKLVSLMYNYSDSDDDETREERKARIAKEKEDRYARRQQRRAELEAKRKEREEEKLRMKEEKKTKQSDSDKKTQSEDSELTKTSSGSDPQKSEESQSEEKAFTATPGSPKKKTKQELKDQLREQKVMEKKLALRRQRTRTRRYTSEEFTSIFTEKPQPFSSQSYTAVEEVVESECVVETTPLEETVETVPLPEGPPPVPVQTDLEEQAAAVLATTPPRPGSPASPATPTQDERYVYPEDGTSQSLPTGIPVYEISVSPSIPLTIGQVVHETRSRTRKISDERKSNETHSTGRPGSPFSDISENSKPESIGEQQERRPKRRRVDSTSPLGAESAGGKSRRMSGVSPTDTNKSLESPETRARGQRYSVDDLYKPRTSHRRSFSPPPSPPVKPKPTTPTTPSARRRSSPSTDRSSSPPLTRRHTPPPPLSAPHSSKRYDADDLYKPRQPSSRSSRYLQRQPPELCTTSRDQGNQLSDVKSEETKRELPFAAKSLTEADPTGDRECSPGEAERKRNKQPIEFVNFGEAARRRDQRKPQDKFRGRSWGKDLGRYERKPQMIRKYFDGGWSDVEKPGSRSPASSHSSGSGSHYSATRRETGWKDTYDSEPSIIHRSGSHSPSKVSRAYDMGEPGPSSIGRNRSPPSMLPYDPAQTVGPMRALSPCGFEGRRPPPPLSPGRRRAPSPYSPGDDRSPSPLSPSHQRPPSPPSPGLGQSRPLSPPSPPSPPRHPPSPVSPDRRRPSSPTTPPSDPGPRTRRHPAMSPPTRRQTRNSLYRPVMNSPATWGSPQGRGWAGHESDKGRYLRSRSPPRAGRSRDMRGMRGGKGSPPPAKRPKR